MPKSLILLKNAQGGGRGQNKKDTVSLARYKVGGGEGGDPGTHGF